MQTLGVLMIALLATFSSPTTLLLVQGERKLDCGCRAARAERFRGRSRRALVVSSRERR
jgi:hypothetical protein